MLSGAKKCGMTDTFVLPHRFFVGKYCNRLFGAKINAPIAHCTVAFEALESEDDEQIPDLEDLTF